MPSKVYCIDLRTSHKENLYGKLERLLNRTGLARTIKKRDLVAVKLHFGETGNTAYIRPVFIGKISRMIKALGGFPFLTDSNTLYAGTRGNSANHIETALYNGFTYSTVDAPIIIADGLRGRSEIAVSIKGNHFDQAYIGAEIVNADALVSVAHFKGHELSGFGGTIKNVGMGSASRRGKLAQHSSLSPKVKSKKCIGCGDCVVHCSQKALTLVEKKAVINADKCIGCGECILICENEAIQIRWNQSIPIFQENMVEYTLAVLKNKKRKALFINFITDVSPACDCYDFNDAPIVRNIGIVASIDPVAIDQASVDLVNQEAALPGCCLTENTAPGEDKFGALYPKVDWHIQLKYAEKLKLGRCNYDLVTI